METEKNPRGLGRPCEFDKDEALDSALRVFWQKGYEGASLSDLTVAMGINRPSLYAAFGNKEQLFRKVLDRYAEGPALYGTDALNQPTARAVVEKLFCGAIGSVENCGIPQGCILVQGALACGDEADSVRKELAARRLASQNALHERFERAKLEGDLPSEVDAAALACYIMTVLYGISVQASGGISCEELQGVARIALQCWPQGNIS